MNLLIAPIIRTVPRKKRELPFFIFFYLEMLITSNTMDSVTIL